MKFLEKKYISLVFHVKHIFLFTSRTWQISLLSLQENTDKYRLAIYFNLIICFVVNNKYIALINGFKLCSLISFYTHVRSKSIAKI